MVMKVTPLRTATMAALMSLGVYLLTLSPSFGFVDKGEMAAVASTLGIAHPTGYPTLMLLGYVFTRVLPMRDVVALNVMAALLVAASTLVLSLLFFDVSTLVHEADALPVTSKKKKKKKKKEVVETRENNPLTGGWLAAYAALAALFTSLTLTWWSQGNGFEVYSMHALMVPLVTLLFLRYVEQQKQSATVGPSKRGNWFGMALGLSFTNHLTTILLAPAFLFYFFGTLGFQWRSLKRLLWIAPSFFLGLLPYLWLPLRASMQPPFNWGDPSTIKRFVDHVTGRQYRVWMFTNPETFKQQTAYFFRELPAELGYVGLLVALLGVFALSGRRTRQAWWSLAVLVATLTYLWFFTGSYGVWPLAIIILMAAGLVIWDGEEHLRLRMLNLSVTLMFVTTVIYASGYDIMEIRPYYLTAVFAVGIWAVLGLNALHKKLGGKAALAVAVLLVVATGVSNTSECNERDSTLVEDMTRDVLDNLPQNALILSAQWDFWVAGSWYLQAVENVRPDVLVIDPELLRRSWYLDQIERTYPRFMASVDEETSLFRAELFKFEHQLPFDASVIEAAYKGLMDAMIRNHIEERPVLVTSEVRADVGTDYLRVPYHLAFQLVKDDAYVPQDFPNYRYRALKGRISVYTTKLAELYARNIYARALYEAHHDYSDLAGRYLELASSFDPGVTLEDIPPQPLDGKARVADTLEWFEGLRN
jgi:hypothetical protein